MKKILFVLLIFLPSILSAEPAVIIHTKDGNTIYYKMSSKPTIKFGNGNLILKSSDASVEYPLSNYLRFSFGEYIETGVESATISPSFLVSRGTIEGENLTPNSIITIYNASGEVMTEIKADTNGKFAIDKKLLQKGVYIVKTNKTSFKVSI